MLYDLLGRFGALFASIPFTLFAAMYCVLFGYVGTYLLYLQMSKGNFYVSIVCYCLCYFTRFQLSKKKKELLPYLIERQSSYLLFKKKDFSSPKSKPTPLFWCLSGAVGLSIMQFTNMNSTRNLFVLGISLYLGISIPNYFHQFTTSYRREPVHTRAGWVCDH